MSEFLWSCLLSIPLWVLVISVAMWLKRIDRKAQAEAEEKFQERLKGWSR